MHNAMGSGYLQGLTTMFQRLLDEVDKDVTRVQDKLTNGMKRVAWVIKKNEGMHGSLEIREKCAEPLLTSVYMNIDTASSCCIALLILVLIILLVLLLLV